MANVSPVLDLRRHPRHKVRKGGKLVSLTLLSSIDVTIIDMSVGGARIRLPATSNFPETFWLLVVSEKLLYPADVRWRRGELIGIEFTGEPVGLTTPPVRAIAGL